MALRNRLTGLYADLLANNLVDQQTIIQIGNTVVGDQPERLYKYDSGSSATHNPPAVVAPTNNIGRYLLKTNPYMEGAIALTTSGSGATTYSGGTLNVPTPSIPSTARTTSPQSMSLVGTGATGTQISATNAATVRFTVSTSTTSTIGGPATSVVVLKKCATNSVTEGDWTSVATFESDQTITLAIALQSIQVVKGQLTCDLDAGWYVKLVNSGTGTHSEAFVSGEKTIYG